MKTLKYVIIGNCFRGGCMYQLKLATTQEEILQFESMREQVFNKGKKLTSLMQASYADAITSGDMLAFQCFKEEELVGGMLLRLQGKDIKLSRLFVDSKERGQGAGSFMMDYVMKHKSFFEDYYATEIYGIVTEPLATAVDFYFDKGFDYSGYQMYKQFENTEKKHHY